MDGIIGGVGAVLGFVPQMLVLFIFLAFLEACGYMARIAFIMDRIFRRFGLSGKSFIPMLIGTGCGVPGVMASRTIENDRDRKMTIMTTTFIPCGAKLPIIALIAGALFGGASWVAPSAYFVGIAAIICSGIILKKTKMFVGDPVSKRTDPLFLYTHCFQNVCQCCFIVCVTANDRNSYFSPPPSHTLHHHLMRYTVSLVNSTSRSGVPIFYSDLLASA